MAQKRDFTHNIALADGERIRARADRSTTPSVQDVFQILTGAAGAFLGQDSLSCGPCGRHSAMDDQCTILQESCMGCAADHCRTCLWTPPGTIHIRGVCAHCVFDFVSPAMGGCRDSEHDDESVLAGALADDGFVQYAKELGHIWDDAEKRVVEYRATDASGLRTPDDDVGRRPPHRATRGVGLQECSASGSHTPDDK